MANKNIVGIAFTSRSCGRCGEKPKAILYKGFKPDNVTFLCKCKKKKK